MPTSALVKKVPNRADVGIGPYDRIVIGWCSKFQFIVLSYENKRPSPGWTGTLVI